MPKNIAKLRSLSVFFPCFNEEKNIAPLIKKCLKLLPELANRYEVIVVNDGSTDRTAHIVKKFTLQYPNIRVIHHHKNLGYGAAVKSGLTAARYQWVFFTDGDGQFDLNQLKSFLPHTNKHKAIIGYRVERAEGWRRVLNAKLYKLLIDTLFQLHVKDIDCAFKLFKNDVIKTFSLQSNGAFLSAELLCRLKRKKVAFKELPVDHLPRKYGNPTGSNIKVIIKALREAIQLYWESSLTS